MPRAYLRVWGEASPPPSPIQLEQGPSREMEQTLHGGGLGFITTPLGSPRTTRSDPSTKQRVTSELLKPNEKEGQMEMQPHNPCYVPARTADAGLGPGHQGLVLTLFTHNWFLIKSDFPSHLLSCVPFGSGAEMRTG